MYRRTLIMSLGRALAALPIASLALVAPRAASAADVNYTFQPLAQIGGMAGTVPIPKGFIWFLGPLNDNGQFIVNAAFVPGILLQYTDGTFTELVAAGMDGPLGPWRKDVSVNWPFSMNQGGNSVFQLTRAGVGRVGTFYHDAQTDKTTAVALPGMPAIGNLTFAGDGAGAAINNRGEIALAEQVKGAGSPTANGLFFRTPDGALQPIFVPGQSLPDGKKAQPAAPSITDASVVAFLALPSGDSKYSAYEWQNGSITPLVSVGMDAPGGEKIVGVTWVLLNNRNASALIAAHVTGKPGSRLYRHAGGTLTAVAVPGQEMPGGGKFKWIADNTGVSGPAVTLLVSTATEAGQHAFIATLDDNSTAVYRLEPDGTLALVVKSGMTTPLGKITRFGQYSPPAMNSKGQVVVSITFDNGPETLVLLTPTTP